MDVSRYEPVKLLGLGKSSLVYEVVDTKSGSKDAKYAFKRVFLQTNKAIFYTKRECNIMRRLAASETRCPFVADLLHSFRYKDSVVFIETLGSQYTLKHLIRRNDRIENADHIRFYLCEIMCGLHYLHANFIVHCDLKPSNVVLANSGHVLITDMDGSFDMRYGPPTKSDLHGTEGFFPPEMIQMHSIVPKSDIWSLGVTLAYMRFGYKTDIESFTIAKGLCLNARKWMQATNWDGVSCDLRGVFEACLQEDLDSRPDTEALKKLPFFKDVSWTDVEQCKLIPPYLLTPRRTRSNASQLVLEAAHADSMPVIRNSRFVTTKNDEEASDHLLLQPPVDIEALGWTEKRLNEYLKHIEFANPSLLDQSATSFPPPK